MIVGRGEVDISACFLEKIMKEHQQYIQQKVALLHEDEHTTGVHSDCRAWRR